MMCAHANRAAQFEYLQPKTDPVPFDFEKYKKRIHNVVDSVKIDPPIETMRMVLIDGKWRLMY